MTAFFVPGVEPDRAEARYAELAAIVDAPVLPSTARVLSMQFVEGAEKWTATVGERLSGQMAATTGRRASAPNRQVSDPATVLAIFDIGESYVVLTDGHPIGSVGDSTWDNPFPVARHIARRVARFAG